MAFFSGKAANFQIDDSGGTLRDISAYVKSIDFTEPQDLLDTTTFGATGGARTRIPGLRDATISISGDWDPTATTGPDVVLSSLIGAASSSTFKLGPQGSTAAQIQYTGECFCSSYQVQAPVEGLVTFTAQFSVTGTVTRTTY